MTILKCARTALFLVVAGALHLLGGKAARADTFAELNSIAGFGNICLQTGATRASCSTASGPFNGSSSTGVASFGSLGAYAKAVVSGPGFFSLTAIGEAEFGDSFTVTGGPGSGFLMFNIATSGSITQSCADTTEQQFACQSQAAFGTLQFNNLDTVAERSGAIHQGCFL
jgi:hypothetical protein